MAALPARERRLCVLLATTGLRIGEALGLNWDDVEFGRRPKLHVRRQYYRGELRDLKTSQAARTLPLAPNVARQLRQAKKTATGDAVFSTRTGARLSDRNVRRSLERACKVAGATRVGCHRLRHTFASMLYNDSKDIRQVSAWLGHADPAFTFRTYVHLVDSGLGEPPRWNLGKAA